MEVGEQVIWLSEEELYRESQRAEARQEHSKWTGGTAQKTLWLELNEGVVGGEARESAENKTAWLFEKLLPFTLSKNRWRVLSVKR